jgi:hypothetical protein
LLNFARQKQGLPALDQGIAMSHVDSFHGQDDVAVWVSEFTDQ